MSTLLLVRPALGVVFVLGSALVYGPSAVDQPDESYAAAVLSVIGVFVIPAFILGVLHLILALHLARRSSRRLCLTITAITSLGLPIGTALGIWTAVWLNQPSIRSLLAAASLSKALPTGGTNKGVPAHRDAAVPGPAAERAIDRRFPDLSIWTVGPWILTWLLSFWLLAILIEPEYKWGSVTLGFGKFVAAHGYHPTYDRQALYATLITVALYTARTFVLPRLRSRFKDRA